MTDLTGAGEGRTVQDDLVDVGLVHVHQRALQSSQKQLLFLQENLSFVRGYVHIHAL